ncbi:MAG: alanyl-tRNA editing protein [Clostridia bacterium]|nr:alanyl-tRNA editing protein [Clostridia bacterium]
MTVKLYDENAYLKEFTATVVSCEKCGEGFAVELDRTAFFPEAGGQSSDRGFLGNACVTDVQIQNEKIIHFTDTPLQTGSTVSGALDFDRRFDFMQQHSAEHIVSGIAHRLYGCENVGFHLSEDIVTLDFDKELTREQISKVEQLANSAVFANKAIHTYYPDSQALKALSYRSKKEIEGSIRIVEIEDTDTCACCAPHVKSTGEVGLIKLLGAEKLRGGVRLQLKAGMRALDDYNSKYENTLKISNALCVKQEETAEAVNRLCEKVSELKASLGEMKRKSILSKAQSYTPDREITAEFEPDLEMKELQLYSDALFKKAGGIRAVFSGCNREFLFAICGDAKALDSFFTHFKEQFTVKGGGRNGMVQGTVFAEKNDIIEAFERD